MPRQKAGRRRSESTKSGEMNWMKHHLAPKEMAGTTARGKALGEKSLPEMAARVWTRPRWKIHTAMMYSRLKAKEGICGHLSASTSCSPSHPSISSCTSAASTRRSAVISVAPNANTASEKHTNLSGLQNPLISVPSFSRGRLFGLEDGEDGAAGDERKKEQRQGSAWEKQK